MKKRILCWATLALAIGLFTLRERAARYAAIAGLADSNHRDARATHGIAGLSHPIRPTAGKNPPDPVDGPARTDGPKPSQDEASRAARIHAAAAAGVRLRYGAMFRALKFTAAQQHAFEAAALDAEYRLSDLAAAAGAQPLPSGSETYQKMKTGIEQDATNQETALLTSEQIAALNYYDRTEAIRATLAGVAGAAYASEPLTSQQIQAAVAAVAALPPAPRAGMVNDAFDAFDLSTAQSQLAGILTPAQLKIFSAIVTGEQGVFDILQQENGTRQAAARK